MAWEVPVTFTTEVLDASDLNAMLNGNMNETAVAKANERNGYFVSTGANALAERHFKRAFEYEHVIVTADSSDHADIGPSLDITHGGALLVLWNARIHTDGSTCTFGPAIVDKEPMVREQAMRCQATDTDLQRGFCFRWFEGLDPGTDTVMLRGFVGTGEANVAQRELILMPY